MTVFYTLERPEHAWGDYGDILVHGMSCRPDDETEILELERTGPFISPITFPGISEIVVTDDMRGLLETSGLKGIGFRAISKTRIVQSNWHTWDLNADDPAEYPPGGEPEGYILGHEHSLDASEKIGQLWEVVLARTARVVRAGSICTKGEIRLVTASWRGEDLFMAQDVGYIYATEKAKHRLEEKVGCYVAFDVAGDASSA